MHFDILEQKVLFKYKEFYVLNCCESSYKEMTCQVIEQSIGELPWLEIAKEALT